MLLLGKTLSPSMFGIPKTTIHSMFTFPLHSLFVRYWHIVALYDFVECKTQYFSYRTMLRAKMLLCVAAMALSQTIVVILLSVMHNPRTNPMHGTHSRQVAQQQIMSRRDTNQHWSLPRRDMTGGNPCCERQHRTSTVTILPQPLLVGEGKTRPIPMTPSALSRVGADYSW
jgi:hypothetical protein